MDNQSNYQDELRSHLAKILEILRTQEVSNSEEARANKIAITQVELASMCVIRSFFAKEPYSPLQKLKPINQELTEYPLSTTLSTWQI